MGVCLSRCSQYSGRGDAGGSTASRPEPPPIVPRGRVTLGESTGYPTEPVSQGVAASASASASADDAVRGGRPRQRRRTAGTAPVGAGAFGAAAVQGGRPAQRRRTARTAPVGAGALGEIVPADVADASAAVADPSDRAGEAAMTPLPRCTQVYGLRVPVPAPVQAFLDPAEGWVRPDLAVVDKLVRGYAIKVRAGPVHADALLAKLRNPKAVANAPVNVVRNWVEDLASAVEAGQFDYANRVAYGGFNLESAYPLVGMNTWNPPTDINMITDPAVIRAAASLPAADTQFALGKGFLCNTMEWEIGFVESVFAGRHVDLSDVGDKALDGHPSFNECPAYKAADRDLYGPIFAGDKFPDEPVGFGNFPADGSPSAMEYVLGCGLYPIFAVNGKGPNQRTLKRIQDMGGSYMKLSDASARVLGSRYGSSGVEYTNKDYFGVFFALIPSHSTAGGHLMLIVLNPQLGTTMGGPWSSHAEMTVILKYQADILRVLGDTDIVPFNDNHPLARLTGKLGMHPVFAVARAMSESDERGERYATSHARGGKKGGATKRATKEASTRWDTITGPHALWNYLHVDDSGIEMVWGPIPRCQIEKYCKDKILSENTLVKPEPDGVNVSGPHVTIRKMVACEWDYPGPAEGE